MAGPSDDIMTIGASAKYLTISRPTLWKLVQNGRWPGRKVMPMAGSKRRQATEIDIALADRRLPLDLIVVTPEEFAAYKDVVGHILYPVVREGKVLYEHAA